MQEISRKCRNKMYQGMKPGGSAMNALNQELVARLREDEAVISILAVEKPSLFATITDGFDLLMLVISNDDLRTD
jgi:hypothetical protein